MIILEKDKVISGTEIRKGNSPENAKVINISEDIYPIDEVITDLVEIKDKIEELVIVTILKDGTAFVSHTGLNFLHMALACKLMDKEFSNTIDLASETEDI